MADSGGVEPWPDRCRPESKEWRSPFDQQEVSLPTTVHQRGRRQALSGRDPRPRSTHAAEAKPGQTRQPRCAPKGICRGLPWER